MRNERGIDWPDAGKPAEGRRVPERTLVERLPFTIGLGISTFAHTAAIALALFGGQIFAADPAVDGPVANVSILSVAEFGALISNAPSAAGLEAGPLPAPDPSLESAADQPDGPSEPRGSPALAGLSDAPAPPTGNDPPDWAQSWAVPVEQAPDSPSITRPPLRPAAEPAVLEAEAAKPSTAALETAAAPEAPSPVAPPPSSPSDRVQERDSIAAERPSAEPSLAASLQPSDEGPDAVPAPLVPRDVPEAPLAGLDSLFRNQPDADPVGTADPPPPQAATEPDAVSVPTLPLPPPDASPPELSERGEIDLVARVLPPPPDASPAADGDAEAFDVALLDTGVPPSTDAVRQGIDVPPPGRAERQDLDPSAQQPPVPVDVAPPAEGQPEAVDVALSASSVPFSAVPERQNVDAAAPNMPAPSSVASLDDAKRENEDGALMTAAVPPTAEPERQGVAVESPVDGSETAESSPAGQQPPSPADVAPPAETTQEEFDVALSAASVPPPAETERQNVDAAAPALPAPSSVASIDDAKREDEDGALLTAAVPPTAEPERQGVAVEQPVDESETAESSLSEQQPPSPADVAPPAEPAQGEFDVALSAASVPPSAATERQNVDAAAPTTPVPSSVAAPDDAEREEADGTLLAAAAPSSAEPERQGVGVERPADRLEAEESGLSAQQPPPPADIAPQAEAERTTADVVLAATPVPSPGAEQRQEVSAEVSLPPPAGVASPDEAERDVLDSALLFAAAPPSAETERHVVDVARPVSQQEPGNTDVAASPSLPSGLLPAEGSGLQDGDIALLPPSVAPSDVVAREEVEVAPPPPAPAESEVIEVAALPPPPRNLPESVNDEEADESDSGFVRAAPPAPRPSGQSQPTGSAGGPTAQLDFLGAAVESLPQDGGGRAGLPFAAVGQPLSGSERGYLVSKISGCWRPLPIVGQAGARDLEVTIGVELTLDGNVAAEPILVAPNPLPSGNTAYRVAFDLARSAVKGCAPYDQLPREKYQRWRNIEISFNPEGMVSR